MANIYLDHAATTPLDTTVLSGMMPYLEHHFGNPSSIHAAGRTNRAAIEKSRKLMASVLGVSPAEIVFTSGGTESDNQAILGSIFKGEIQHIISTKIEHHAVLHTIEFAEKMGWVEAHWLAVDQAGNFDFQELAILLEKYPSALVSLMHGNNEIGNLLDIERTADLCKHYGAIFHSDTVQTVGVLPMEPTRWGVHYMVGSAHKFNGPKGVGFLYVQGGTAFEPLLHGGAQERNQRAGTENVAGIVGMALALEKAQIDKTNKFQHLQTLKQHLQKELFQTFDGLVCNGNSGNLDTSLPGILNVGFPPNLVNDMFLFNLDIAGIQVSGGSACNSGALAGSHVLETIGASNEFIHVRFSMGAQNTLDEINQVISTIKQLI